jgi:glucose-1-phosphate thymidylyltransferase
LPSLIKELIREEEPIDAILTNKPWEDVVYPWDLLKVNEKCITPARLKSGTIEKGVTLKGDVSIGKNTLIRSGSYLVGPIVIGRNCEIGPHACILPSTVIGDEVRIAPFSLIRNSLLMDECKIGSGALVNHSVLGKGVRWGAKVSNLADDCIIEIEGKYKHVNNFGIIVGDDAEIGEGSTLKAGVIVGRNCSIAPLKVIEESIPSKVKVM